MGFRPRSRRSSLVKWRVARGSSGSYRSLSPDYRGINIISSHNFQRIFSADPFFRKPGRHRTHGEKSGRRDRCSTKGEDVRRLPQFWHLWEGTLERTNPGPIRAPFRHFLIISCKKRCTFTHVFRQTVFLAILAKRGIILRATETLMYAYGWQKSGS